MKAGAYSDSEIYVYDMFFGTLQMELFLQVAGNHALYFLVLKKGS